MEPVEKLVQRVALRLTAQRALEILLWAWTVAAFGAAAAAAGGKLLGWSLSRILAISAVVFVAATVVGLIVAWIRRVRPLRAAVELDRAFDLQDRVTSAISLTDDLRQQPAAQALLRDLSRWLDSIDPAATFSWRVPRAAVAPLLPLLLGMISWLLLPTWQRESQAVDRAAVAEDSLAERQELAERVQRAMNRLEQDLATLLPQVAEEGQLAELRELLAELERLARDAGTDRRSLPDPEKTLQQLGDIEKRLQEQRDRLAEQAKVRNTLQELARRASQVATATNDPIRQFQQALQRGDLERAARALKKLAEQLRKSDLPAEQKRVLQNQLQRLHRELQKLRSLEQARRRLARSGLKGEQLEKALDALRKQLGSPEQLAKLAQSLAQAARAAGGQGGKAAEQLARQLDQLAAQLEQLADDAALQQLADDLLSRLADLRQHLGCQKCMGGG